MKIVLLVALYILPIARFIACIYSSKLKQKVFNKHPFKIACVLYGFLSLANLVVIFISASDSQSSSASPLAFYLPVQIVLIIMAENFIARAKRGPARI